MKHLSLVVIVLVTVVFGCNKTATSQEGAQKAEVKGTVVIEVADVKITDADVKEELAVLPAQLKTFVSTKEGRKEFIDSLVKREILYQEAKAKGLDNNEKIKKDVERLKKRFMVDTLLRDVIKTDSKVDEKTLKEYFKKNEKKFEQAEKTHTKHILVKEKKTADEIAEKLKKDPSQFEKLAAEQSTDSSAKQGGDIGAHEKGDLIPEYEAAADKLKKPGDISPVVKSQYGFHIIKLVSREKAQVPKFDDVKDDIKEEYLKENQKQVFDKLMDELKKKYKTTVNEQALESIGQ